MDSRSAAQAAQLGAIGVATGIPIAPLVGSLPAIEPFLAQQLWVAMRGDGKELALIAPIPHTDVSGWIAPLDSAVIGSARPLTHLLGAAQSGTRELELRTSQGRLAVAARVIGKRSADDDVAVLVGLGVNDATRLRLGAYLESMPNDAGAYVARVDDGALEVEIGRVVPPTEQAVAAIDLLAAGVGVSAPQRALVRQIHLLLARGSNALVTLTATSREVLPRLSIRYAPMHWDNALRFVTGLYRGDSATRLGTFAGAVGSDRVAWLDVVLGDTEPPLSWIAGAQRAVANHLA